jgi:2-polyprenyl-3-methyl-5-hydroxy-6-metoxy-1,4-benzoquinol methylase
MNNDTGRLTEQSFWDQAHSRNRIRLRLPSSLNVSVADQKRLLRRYLRPGMKVLEIGFAPGKMLAWAAKAMGVEASGIDYSQPGVEQARELFAALGITADLRCEDVFRSTFRPGFDVVCSFGVIEHFDDPRPIVRLHMEMLRPGGLALITIPNYATHSPYGALQRYFDPDLVDVHNLEIMNTTALAALVPSDLATNVRVFPFGRLTPSLVNWHKKLPTLLARTMTAVINCVGLVQPREVATVAPWLVLTATRR